MLLPEPVLRTRAFPLVVVTVVTLLLGVLASLYVYARVDETAKKSLIDRANTMARMIPAEDILQLSGSDIDVYNPEYQALKKLLMDVRAVNADLRFIYLVGESSEGSLFFYLDSEDPSSPDMSPPGQIYDEAPETMYALFEDGQSRTDTYPDRWGSWVSGYAPVRTDTGSIVALLGIDIPAEKHLYATLSQALLPFLLSMFLALISGVILYIRARELRYVAQKAEFISIASHEIRTPLTSMRWGLSTLLDHPIPLAERDRNVLTHIHSACGKLITRINSLLNTTAIEAGKKVQLNKQVVSLKRFIGDIFDDLALSAHQKDVALRTDSSVREDTTIVCDPEYLRQVFFNLIANAIKYTNEHTSVTVSYRAGAHGHEIRVSDQGKGVASSELNAIFEGYHRTLDALKSGEYGTGIGLYLSLQILKLHGGSIAAEQNQDAGATFVVTLPVDGAFGV